MYYYFNCDSLKSEFKEKHSPTGQMWVLLEKITPWYKLGAWTCIYVKVLVRRTADFDVMIFLRVGFISYLNKQAHCFFFEMRGCSWCVFMTINSCLLHKQRSLHYFTLVSTQHLTHFKIVLTHKSWLEFPNPTF